jgi:hypothetical protein
MGQALPNQHPAVVLRSRYTELRALLAIAMVALIGLAVAVVVLAINDNGGTSLGSATELSVPSGAAATRSDGGPEESTLAGTIAAQPGVSGPDESSIAEAIGTADAPTTTGGPSESNIAEAIGSADAPTTTDGPDESVVAGAVSGR